MAYDKENRRLYVDKANNKGITTREIADCLRDYRVNKKGQRDLGMLCTSGKINKWAKFKPVRYNSTDPLIESQMKDVNYGLKFPSYLWFNLFNATPQERILMYEQPRGTSVTPIEHFQIGRASCRERVFTFV